jgi:hypothetical protein
MCVCMYVCMYVCVYVCVYVCNYVWEFLSRPNSGDQVRYVAARASPHYACTLRRANRARVDGAVLILVDGSWIRLVCDLNH